MRVLLLFSIVIFPCFAIAQSVKKLNYDFPLPRPHMGLIIGNGTQGLMIWGENDVLSITIGQNGFWDHRGANELKNLTNFNDFKEIVHQKGKVGKLFGSPKSQGLHRQIGGGVLEIKFPQGYKLKRGVLDLHTATASIYLVGNDNKETVFTIRQLIKAASEFQLAWLDMPAHLKAVYTLQPSWNWIKKSLEPAGISAPKEWQTAKGVKGFTQTLPEDDPLNIAYKQEEGLLLVGSYLGKMNQSDFDKNLTANAIKNNLASTEKWWKDYWLSVPKINIPDPVIQEIADMGLYKQACVNPPHAKAAGLQGPFHEHHQLPPWGGDFHYNVNVEMIYEPSLASNRPNHFNPIWDLIHIALPKFRANGEKFYGRKNALLFPHATDDRGNLRGGFWAGIVDQGNVAWMATLAWRHYRYTLDKDLLAKTAWPLLEGAFETYYSILEEVDDKKGGKRFSLPVSVSPEYGGTSLENATGRDASFQLAALHSITTTLPKAAKILGKPLDSRWEDVSKRLPQYTTIDGIWMPEKGGAGIRIALWEGQDLEGSHRHHSHLAGIYPFSTIDPYDPVHYEVLTNTMHNFVFKGAGNWVGWSVPWTSAIWSRMGATNVGVKWLRYWADNYLNAGRGSLAFLSLPGVAVGADFRFNPKTKAYPWDRERNGRSMERMQMDASMGALSAVYELLVQNKKDDILDVLPAIPDGWRNFDFSGILTEGAFLVSATVKDGKTAVVKIKSTKGGLLKMKHNLGKSYKMNGKEIQKAASVLEYNTKAGEEVLLERI
ncbi:glycosyl hydrolase family 95 catalytic domain-containing protein [Pseudopedobacter beijingensis]|uniref:Glycoside hydrolase family 95-like protein n=1 Tax=Pseudopedobacter beijingensis TaxID=1207056 RepID=A0ABW4IBL8_9SPHI